MKKKRISKIWIFVLLLAIAAVAFWLLSGEKKEEVINFSTVKVEETTLRNSVTATGTIEPVTSVTVGTQVSGIVRHLYVDYNSVVKKGQVIAELDKTNLTSELNTAKANLSSAQSALNYQEANYKRYQTLFNKGLVSADDFESAHTSPIDGVVLSKSVEEGQTVAASFNTPELFTIAKDLTNMQVVANVDEADIGGVKAGERVTFTVDAYPEDTFHGTVTQVRQEATTTNNVVTYEVVISAPNSQLKLKPGLTASVTIYTFERNGVLCVPTKALRFTPTKETIGKQRKMVDCNGKNKLWTLEGDLLKAHPVKLGQTDGTNTEIVSGVSRGMEVISEVVVTTEEEPQGNGEERSPFAPGPPRRNNNKK